MPINAFYDGVNSISSGTVQLFNGNGISFGINGQTVTGTVQTNYLTAINISDGGASSNLVTELVFANSNNISFGLSNGTLTASYAPPMISSYENMQPFVSNIVQVFNGASISHCVAFNLPLPIDASFIRIAASMTTGSTTLATTAASMNASCAIYHTYNAVVYSVGNGLNSANLLSVASGSAGATFMNSLSLSTDGTSGSYSQFFSYHAAGNDYNFSTQYTVANTNYSFTTNQIATNFSGNRWLEVHFNNTLSAGDYWLVVGYSSSSFANSTGVSAATKCNVSYSNHYGASQANIAFGVLGSTNFTSGGLMGAGSFSTAGGGTVSFIPLANISSSASNVRLYFQLLQSS